MSPALPVYKPEPRRGASAAVTGSPTALADAQYNQPSSATMAAKSAVRSADIPQRHNAPVVTHAERVLAAEGMHPHHCTTGHRIPTYHEVDSDYAEKAHT
jgi:hypothetical protein